MINFPCTNDYYIILVETLVKVLIQRFQIVQDIFMLMMQIFSWWVSDSATRIIKIEDTNENTFNNSTEMLWIYI